MENFNIGDEIYHKSNPSVKWVIEQIDGNEIRCSTLLNDSLKQVKETFLKSSIEKCGDGSMFITSGPRRNHQW
ncbi:hypothetical protein ACK8HY_09525 [Sphingobacterium sp. NGMCC 1.201703]|uniref:hypothetical protein n=1 Tax=Sphingobacterium sp. NGMCC 1.201703 TaxID=3388657 RepID=UPI0039FBABCD